MTEERSQDVIQNDEEGSIFGLIQHQEWETVIRLCQTHPAIANTVDPVTAQSPLHVVCSIGSAPPEVIEAVATACPEMSTRSDKVYHDTPLHIVCRNSQTTGTKACILLRYCGKEGVLCRNVIGGTPLHSACGHNAQLSVLEQLVQANSAVLKLSTFEGTSPLRALFAPYMQSIPGSLAVANLLKGRHVTEGHFERFFRKAEYLALEYYKMTSACPKEGPITIDYVIHGLIHYDAPLQLLKATLKRNPSWAQVVDEDGNTPLHLLVERRPYRLKELDALKAMLAAFPEAAGMQNKNCQQPLLVAIRNKIPWDNGVGEILRANMDVLSVVDSETKLHPFQLAAFVGGHEALNTTFQLLSALPETLRSR